MYAPPVTENDLMFYLQHFGPIPHTYCGTSNNPIETAQKNSSGLGGTFTRKQLNRYIGDTTVQFNLVLIIYGFDTVGNTARAFAKTAKVSHGNRVRSQQINDADKLNIEYYLEKGNTIGQTVLPSIQRVVETLLLTRWANTGLQLIWYDLKQRPRAMEMLFRDKCDLREIDGSTGHCEKLYNNCSNNNRNVEEHDDECGHSQNDLESDTDTVAPAESDTDSYSQGNC